MSFQSSPSEAYRVQAEQLIVSDPRALQHIVVKDQDIYEETDMFILGNKLIFGEGLIATLGEQHRKQRKMLNPVFSLGNMRELLPIIQPIASQLRTVLSSRLSSDGGESSDYHALCLLQLLIMRQNRKKSTFYR